MQARTFFPTSIPFAILLAGCITAIPPVRSDNRAANAKAICDLDMEDGLLPAVVSKDADKIAVMCADGGSPFPGDMPAVTGEANIVSWAKSIEDISSPADPLVRMKK